MGETSESINIEKLKSGDFLIIRTINDKVTDAEFKDIQVKMRDAKEALETQIEEIPKQVGERKKFLIGEKRKILSELVKLPELVVQREKSLRKEIKVISDRLKSFEKEIKD